VTALSRWPRSAWPASEWASGPSGGTIGA